MTAAADPVPSLNESAMAAARHRWSNRAKPPGSLGQLEDVAVRIAGMSGRCPPPVPQRPAVVVFAADHGVAAAGASAWPQSVTAAMVATVAAGGAAINALAASIGATVTVVDVGVATVLDHPGVQRRAIRRGTGNIETGPAMSAAESAAAIALGAELAGEMAASGADCLIGGDLGIGNTTASTAVICALTGGDPTELTGPGAGLPPGGLPHKRRLVAAALDRLGGSTDPAVILAELGGLEIAALAGFYAGAAQRRIPCIVDGVIAAAALCVAEGLAPGTAGYAIAGHLSAEPAAAVALARLGLQPLLDLGLRLGEGTGAAVAFPLVVAAVTALRDMAELPGV